jgi:hypothetical protein
MPLQIWLEPKALAIRIGSVHAVDEKQVLMEGRAQRLGGDGPDGFVIFGQRRATAEITRTL